MTSRTIGDRLRPWGGIFAGTFGAGFAHQLGVDSTFQDCTVGSPLVVTIATIAGLAIVGALLTLSSSVSAILTGLALSSTAVFVEQASANAFISRAAPGARSTAIGVYLSFYYFGGSLGSILPVPAWNRWGWVGCVAFVVVAQAIAGALVFFFWRGTPPAGASKPRSPEVRLTR